ncbi:protein kinase [Novipirellula sp.]|uniref:protein kinase domain-containing protein n=1 Tax=Novipirellula sp. TaxID=2795430 RepID=UPI0035660CD3
MKKFDTKELDDLIAAYMDELEQGRKVPPERFIANHPELREPFLRFVSQYFQGNGPHPLKSVPDETSFSDDTPRDINEPTDVPRRLGRYRIIRTLGSGGMSIVYEAIASDRSEPVALKVLHAAAANDSGMRKRFRREAETIRSLNHPHVVPLRDFGTHEGTSFLAMQMIPGETVAQQISGATKHANQFDESANAVDAMMDEAITDDVIANAVSDATARRPNWTMTEIASAIANIADALDHAHRRGVVHRDLKPSNLLIDSDRKVWLTDFGLASANEAQTVLTRTGQIIGTPHYMSPEQASGSANRIDHRTDIYSLGATLYEWVTLKRPHQGGRFHVLLEIVSGRLQPPSKVCSSVPASLEAIIMQSMSQSPADRYASAAEMANDLRRFSSGMPIHARRPGLADQAARWLVRNPKTSIASALGFASVVLAVILTQSLASWRLSRLNTQLAASTATLEHTNNQLATTNSHLYRSQSELRRHLYVADMASAYRAYAQQDIRAVHRLLARQVPGPTTRVSDAFDQRGFEWWLLKNLSRPPEVLTLGKHDGPANEVALNPTGSDLYSVGGDGWVRHWDILLDREVHQWSIGGSLDAIAISADGSKWVTGSNVPTGLNPVTLRLASTGDVAAQLQGHEYSVESAAFSPDGKWIATAGRYHQVLLHDAQGQLHARLTTGSRNESLCFSPDSKQLVGIFREQIDGDHWHSLRSWAVPDLELARIWEFNFSPLTFALSGDGKRMIAADSANWTLTRWDDSQRVSSREGIHGRIRCVAINHDGNRVAAGCDNGLIYVWQIENGEKNSDLPPTRIITTDGHKITSLVFFENDRILASRENGMLQAWSLQESKFQHPTFGVSTRAITRRPTDCDRLFLRGDHGGIERFDLSTLEHEQIARVATDNQYELAVTPDGTMIVAAAPDQLVIVSATDGRELHRIDTQSRGKDCRGLRFIDRGQRLLALYNDRFRQYDTTNWEMIDEITLPNSSARDIISSPDESVMLVVTQDALLFYNLKTLQPKTVYLKRFSPLTSASYAANGQTIAVGHQDGTIELLNAFDAEPIGLLTAHRNTVYGLSFINDDRTLISSSQAGTIRFWDVRSGREIGGLDIADTSADLIHFSEPLQKLFSLGPHRPIKVYSGQRSE